MKFSIVTASYNSEWGIGTALRSLNSQTYADFEHVVVDGGSKDRTLKILKEESPNSKVISEPDRGIYNALNKGIARAQGEIIGFLHSDDVYSSDKVLEEVVKHIGEADALYGDLEYYNKKGIRQRYWSAGTFEPSLLASGWMPPHPALFVRKEVFDTIGVFDTSYRIAADYEWILRFLTRKQTRITYLQQSLVHMTSGGASNRNLKQVIIKSKEDYRAMKAQGFSSPSSVLLRKNLSKIPQFFHR